MKQIEAVLTVKHEGGIIMVVVAVLYQILDSLHLLIERSFILH